MPSSAISRRRQAWTYSRSPVKRVTEPSTTLIVPGRYLSRNPNKLQTCLWSLLASGLLSNVAIGANPPKDRLETMVGLTAGRYDHFQGQLADDGETLSFVSNANTTTEIHRQSLLRNAPTLVFDDNADTSQPRLSPDGQSLLYISYQEDASGDACIYHFKQRDRRCLTDENTEVLHVFWFPDSLHIGALTRTGLLDTHELRKYSVGQRRGDTGELLLSRNIAAPTVSPDGRWLVYVPLEQGTSGQFSFMMRASSGFVLHPLISGLSPRLFRPDMPGSTGFPTFSPDGQYLYFTQFLNDTNFDGVIDGGDNGILFRARFDGDAVSPIRRGSYEQLTSGRRNCQYPSPARDKLIATCLRAGYLQIYSLPLSGLVPPDWTRQRIEEELLVTRDPWERLLLLKRLLPDTEDQAKRIAIYRRIILEHLSLHEYESTEYHLRLLQDLDDADAWLADWTEVLLELTAYRRDEQRLPHGKLNAAFIQAQQERLDRLSRWQGARHSTVHRLAAMARLEILDVLGDKKQALALSDALDLAGEKDTFSLHLIAMQQQKFLRLLDERERLLRMFRQLAEHSAFSERERLRYADAYKRSLLQGLARREQRQSLAKRLETVEPDSPLGFMLSIESHLLATDAASQAITQDHLTSLFQETGSFERRRALIMSAIDHAAYNDYQQLLYTMGSLWLDTVLVGHPERKHAEAIFADIVLEKAYAEMAGGHPAEAAELFHEITETTTSLEAHEGYIEASLRSGKFSEQLLAAYKTRYSDRPKAPEWAFVQAYLRGQRLNAITDLEKHRAEVDRDMALLLPALQVLPRSPEIHHLYAYLAHREFHRSHDHEMAMIAHTHYHLALDLAPRNPRRKASVLHELGLLQAALGNHHIALRHFQERARLPFTRPRQELSFRLDKARSHYFRGRYRTSKSEIESAQTLIDDHRDKLAEFRTLVIDRGAFYHYVGGDYEQAENLYRALLPEITGENLAERLKAHLGLGASLLKTSQYELAIAELSHAWALLDSDEPMRRNETRAGRLDKDDYRHIVAGLLAHAQRGAGNFDAAFDAMRERRRWLLKRFEEYEQETYLQEAASASHHLAVLSVMQGRLGAAIRHIEEGLSDADTWRVHAGVPMDSVTLALLQTAAELCIFAGASPDQFSINLPARLNQAFEIIIRESNPKWLPTRRLFADYLAAFDLDGLKTLE
ncbi:PD40 domain-containing protein [Methylomicrobium alcaliphilum]